MREIPESERVDWANLMPAKALGEEWMAPFNGDVKVAPQGKCPMH
jgi:hypothetical protein